MAARVSCQLFGRLGLYVFVAVLGLLMSTAVWAADKPRSQPLPRGKLELTLERAVRMAVDTNLRMADARLSAVDSEYQRQSAYSDFFPRLEVLYDATIDRYKDPSRIFNFAIAHDSRHISAVFVPDGSFFPVSSTYPYRIDPYRSFTLTATLTQPLYLGGKLISQYKNAQLQVESDRLQVGITRQDLILDVTTAYYNIIRYQKLLEVNGQSMASLQKIRKRAWDFFKSKVFSKADYLSTDSQIYEVRRNENTIRTSLKDAQEQLNYLLRIPLGTMVEVQGDPRYTSAPYNLDNIFDIAARNRLELVKAGISADQARNTIKSAKADLLPNVYAQIRGSRINDDWNVIDPEGINAWAIEGQFRWTFDMFRLRATVKSKQTEATQAEVNRLKSAEDIMRNVLKAYRALKRTEQDFFVNRDAAQSNRERFRVVLERYEGQLANYTEALNAQSALYQSLSAYNDNLLQLKIDLATLEREMGVLGQGPAPR